jgi:hypothetical protein
MEMHGESGKVLMYKTMCGLLFTCKGNLSSLRCYLSVSSKGEDDDFYMLITCDLPYLCSQPGSTSFTRSAEQAESARCKGPSSEVCASGPPYCNLWRMEAQQHRVASEVLAFNNMPKAFVSRSGVVRLDNVDDRVRYCETCQWVCEKQSAFFETTSIQQSITRVVPRWIVEPFVGLSPTLATHRHLERKPRDFRKRRYNAEMRRRPRGCV